MLNLVYIYANWTYEVFGTFCIKVENGLKWFLICFSKKKNVKYGLM